MRAYLSIGEAGDYRGYWEKEWSAQPPTWLGAENPDWKGNFKVRYWQPAPKARPHHRIARPPRPLQA
ncbi:MAG: hypothetical protein EPN23_04615 [Verrucomicrobia bacterium]|nr:MAG: hypothetical protein EPN23_04615 [Verrucomicrobiota bacterium]